MKVCLHSHTAEGSYDGSLPAGHLETLFADNGFGALAITDHDAITEPPRQSLIQPRGIEHTLHGKKHLHVVELSDHDFKFLAHPRLTFPVNTRENIHRMLDELDLDGVEKYNSGVQQYHGDLDRRGVVELANDDCHNRLQIGHSYMTVPDSVDTEEELIGALKAGKHILENDAKTPAAVFGLAYKGLAYFSNTTRRATRQGDAPDRETFLYRPRDRFR